jgi:F0F1-type ATP synthase assembly protein I
MTRSPQSPRDPEQRPTCIAFAVITGALAGATRALVGWLLDHLTNAN